MRAVTPARTTQGNEYGMQPPAWKVRWFTLYRPGDTGQTPHVVDIDAFNRYTGPIILEPTIPTDKGGGIYYQGFGEQITSRGLNLCCQTRVYSRAARSFDLPVSGNCRLYAEQKADVDTTATVLSVSPHFKKGSLHIELAAGEWTTITLVAYIDKFTQFKALSGITDYIDMPADPSATPLSAPDWALNASGDPAQTETGTLDPDVGSSYVDVRFTAPALLAGQDLSAFGVHRYRKEATEWQFDESILIVPSGVQEDTISPFRPITPAGGQAQDCVALFKPGMDLYVGSDKIGQVQEAVLVPRNLLHQNPGFETGDTTNWTPTTSGGPTVAVTSDVAKWGEYSLQASGDQAMSAYVEPDFYNLGSGPPVPAYCPIDQDFAPFTIRFWYQVVDGQAPRLEIYYYDSGGTPTGSDTDYLPVHQYGEWAEYSVTIYAFAETWRDRRFPSADTERMQFRLYLMDAPGELTVSQVDGFTVNFDIGTAQCNPFPRNHEGADQTWVRLDAEAPLASGDITSGVLSIYEYDGMVKESLSPADVVDSADSLDSIVTVRDTDVKHGEAYVYTIDAVGQSGNRSAKTALSTSVTAGDTTAPSEVTGLAATAGVESVTLEWVNPSDDDFRGTNIYHTSVQAANLLETTYGLPGEINRITIGGLTGGVQVTLVATAFDHNKNESSGAGSVNSTPNSASGAGLWAANGDDIYNTNADGVVVGGTVAGALFDVQDDEQETFTYLTRVLSDNDDVWLVDWRNDAATQDYGWKIKDTGELVLSDITGGPVDVMEVNGTAVTFPGTVTANGDVNLGDGGDTLTVNFNAVTWTSPLTTITNLDADKLDTQEGSWYTDADNILMDVLGSPTYTSVQDFASITMSSGFVDGGILSDNGDGTVAVTAGEGLIRASSSSIADILNLDWAQDLSVSLDDEVLNWVYVDYNGGTPQIVSTDDLDTLDNTSEFVLSGVYRSGTEVHILGSGQNVNNFKHNLYLYEFETGPWEHATGIVTSESDTLKLAVTEGVQYYGISRLEFTSKNTNAADRFVYSYRGAAPGTWTRNAGQTTIDVLQYDDGDGGLATLTANRYGVHWVYMHGDDELEVLYGQGNYVLAQALDASPPASVPGILQDAGFLIAKIIARKSAGSFLSVETPWGTVFEGSGVTVHADLAGLGADDHTQYYLADGTRTCTGNASFDGGTFTFNTSEADKDFRVAATGATNALLVQGSDGFVGINDATPNYQLDVNGTVRVVSTLTVYGAALFDGNVTIGDAAGDALTFNPNAWTLNNAVTITGTWTDLGIVSTVDINGGTIDGVTIGGASAGAGSFTTVTTSGVISVDDTTETTSGTTGSIHTDGGLGVAKDIYLGDDLLIATGAVFNWAAGDVTLTHSAGKLTLGGDGAVEVDFANHEMTNVDINSGAIDGATVGAASASTGAFTTLTASSTLDVIGHVAFGSSASVSAADVLLVQEDVTGSGTKYGISSLVDADANMTTLYGMFAQVGTTATAITLGNAVNLFVGGGTKGATSTITNEYGIYISDITNGSVLNYAIYSLGGDVYFGGDVEVGGSLSVTGGTTYQGTLTVDVTDTEALLVRKDGDTGDVLIADTTNMRVGVGVTPTVEFEVSSAASTEVRFVSNSTADAAGAQLTLVHNDASPNDSMYLGMISGRGENSVGAEVTYGNIIFQALDVLSTDEDGAIWFQAARNGVLKSMVGMDSIGIYFYEYNDTTNYGKLYADSDYVYLDSYGTAVSSGGIKLRVDDAGTDAVTILANGNVSIDNGTLTASAGGSLTGTWTDLGIVSTVDINGGTLDGVTIGGASEGAGTFTTLSVTGASITVADNTWIGLGAAKGRIEFDDQATDEVNFLDCNVGIGTASPTGALLNVYGGSGTSGIKVVGTISGETASAGYIDYKTTDGILRLFSQGKDVSTKGEFGVRLQESDQGNGIWAIYADSDANVGINTPSPGTKLDILGDLTDETSGKQRIRLKGYSPSFELMDKDAIQNWYIGIDDDDSNKFHIGRGYGPGQAITPAIAIDISDNVGIGTASPEGTLHVVQNGSSFAPSNVADDLVVAGTTSGAHGISILTPSNDIGYIVFDSPTYGGVARNWMRVYAASAASYGDHMQFGTAGALAVTIDDSGNVGINDSSPSYKLDVNGTLRATGAATFDSTVLISGASLTVADNAWIGLGAAKGRIEFDDQATDEVNFLDCNVGIGTAVPGHRLDITGHVTLSGSIIGRGGTFLDIYMNTSDGSDDKIARIGGGGDVSNTRGGFISLLGNERGGAGAGGAITIEAGNVAGGEIFFKTNNAQRMIMDRAGDVGINETNPGYKLDVNGTFRAVGAATFDSTVGMTGVLTANGGAVFNEAAADVDFRVEGQADTHLFFVDASVNNVGIGGSSGNPGSKLTVINTTASQSALYASSTDTASFAAAIVSSKYGLYIEGATTGADVLLDIESNAGANEILTVLADGKVGIGDPSPSYKLDVNGTLRATGAATFDSTVLISGASLTVADNAWIGLGAAKGRIEFDDQATDEVNFLDCNVGIGTAVPGHRLDITGHVTLSGSIIGRGGTFLDIYMNTSDGSDDKIARIGGGGDVSNTRGGFISLLGNERGGAGAGGAITIEAGNVAGGEIFFKTNNAQRMIMDRAGDVGINETNPGYKLDVNGTFRAVGAATFDSTVGMTGVLTANGGAVFNEAAADVDFRVEGQADTHLFFVDASVNNVGIGGSSGNPGSKLTVINTTASQSALYASSTDTASFAAAIVSSKYGLYIEGATTGADVLLDIESNAGANEILTVLADGKVGIGDPSPSYKLDVNGTLRATGAVTLDSTLDVDGHSAFGSTGVVSANVALAVSDTISVIGTNYGVSSVLTAGASMDFAVGLYSAVKTTATAITLGTAMGLFVDQGTKGATSAITNNYGVYIADMTNGGTLNYALYSVGGDVYFGGEAIFDSLASFDSGISVTGAGTFTTLSILGASITVVDNLWIGLSGFAGRIEFDNQATDEINFLDCRVGIGTVSPNANLDIITASGGVTDVMRIGESTSNYGAFRWDEPNNRLQIQVVTVSTDILSLNPDGGNVGIATNGAAYTLDVNGTLRATGAVTFDNTVGLFGGAAELYIGASAGAGDYAILAWDVGNDGLDIGVQGHHFQIFVQDGGNVGINDSTPTFGLDVNGTLRATGAVTLDSTLDVAGAAIFNEAGADIDFRVEGVGKINALFVQGSDGFVGINDGTPSYQLDVNGTFFSGGAATFNSTITATSGGSLTGTWTDLGTVGTVDINGGTWQGTIDGAWTAAGQTCIDLGSVSTADINGGTLDGATVGAASASTGAFTTLAASSTLDVVGHVGFGSGATPAANAALVVTDTISAAGTNYGGLFQMTAGSTSDKMYGLYTVVSTAAAAITLTDMFGLYVGNGTKGATSTITNEYGIYIANITNGATLNYALYSVGGAVYFGGASTFNSTVDIAGNVGIGVIGGAQQLEVLDASGLQLRLTYTDGAVYTDLGTRSTGYFYIAPSAFNVGIGTAVPAALLEIERNQAAKNTWLRLDNPNANAASGGQVDMVANTGGRGPDTGLHFLVGATSAAPLFDNHEVIYANYGGSSAAGLWLGASHATNGFIHFFTGALNPANERVTIDNAGNVGIGDTSPDARLHVADNAYGGSWLSHFEVDNSSVYLQVWENTSAAQQWGWGMFDNDKVYLFDITDTRYAILFDGDGNCGIGEASPANRLHVTTANAGDGIMIENSYDGFSPMATLKLYKSRATQQNGEYHGAINFVGLNNAVTPEEVTYARIHSYAEDITDGSEDGRLYFQTMRNGTLTYAMYLDRVGDLYIDGTYNTFDDYDDVQEIENLIKFPEKAHPDVRSAIMDANGFWNIVPTMKLLGGGLYQLNDRLEVVEEWRECVGEKVDEMAEIKDMIDRLGGVKEVEPALREMLNAA